MYTNENKLIDMAVSGDNKAMEILLEGVQDIIFNISLRMLGSVYEAEDASQEINIKIIKGLPNFRKESAFSTWVYRISVNTLLNYKESMFVKHPLSFEIYSADINNGFLEVGPDIYNNVDENILTQELKASCTNVMLQCMDAESRCIYIFGIMFRLDSKIAGEILNISPEAYRQRLTRIRKKMSDFMKDYCGLGQGSCNCKKRLGYAIVNHRLSPTQLEYTPLEKIDYMTSQEFTTTMEQMDDYSKIFSSMPKYKNPKMAKEFIEKLILDFHLYQK